MFPDFLVLTWLHAMVLIKVRLLGSSNGLNVSSRRLHPHFTLSTILCLFVTVKSGEIGIRGAAIPNTHPLSSGKGCYKSNKTIVNSKPAFAEGCASLNDIEMKMHTVSE